MWKIEWDFWTSGPELKELQVPEEIRELMLMFARKNLPPIQGQLDLVDREAEILPGIRAIAAPGHTPGHMAVAISSGSEQLLAISDTALYPIHLKQPGWYPAFDFEPEQAMAAKRQLLDRAAAEKALVLGSHFPFPGLGRVDQRAESWQRQPI